MNNKVVLPRDVAEALEDVKRLNNNANIIATIVNDTGHMIYGTDMTRLIKYSHEGNCKIDALMSALVNGYTVEQTPEEKVREYYEDMYVIASNSDYGTYENFSAEVKLECVKKMLNLLGITIEGINA